MKEVFLFQVRAATVFDGKSLISGQATQGGDKYPLS